MDNWKREWLRAYQQHRKDYPEMGYRSPFDRRRSEMIAEAKRITEKARHA